jgi:hypothetical protein
MFAGLLTYRRLAPSHDFYHSGSCQTFVHGLQQRDCSGFSPDSFAQNCATNMVQNYKKKLN